MTELPTLLTLSDRAIALYFILRESGPMGRKELQALTGKSSATIYRTLAELTDAGLSTGMVRRNTVGKVPSVYHATNATSDLRAA